MPNLLEEAQLLIDTFAQRNGADESNPCDILVNLMLWAEQHGRKFGDELTRALNTWLTESPRANDAVLQAWVTQGHPFADDDEQVGLEEAIAEMLVDAQDNALAELSDEEYGPDRLFHEEDLMCLGQRIARLLMTQQVSAQQKHNAEQGVSGGIDDAGEQPPAFVDRHSVDCADCGSLVDERDCLRNPHGEGEVCSDCLAKRDEANRDKIIAVAHAQYAREGSIEIDQGAAFSRGEEGGLYVAAWVWVADEPRSCAHCDQRIEPGTLVHTDDGDFCSSECAFLYRQGLADDDLFCTCDHRTATHVEGQFVECGEICDECGKPLPLALQA